MQPAYMRRVRCGARVRVTSVSACDKAGEQCDVCTRAGWAHRGRTRAAVIGTETVKESVTSGSRQ